MSIENSKEKDLFYSSKGSDLFLKPPVPTHKHTQCESSLDVRESRSNQRKE
jgi:hypothetical protein